MPVDGWLRTSQTAAMAFLCVFEDGDEPSAAAGLHIVHRLRVGYQLLGLPTSYGPKQSRLDQFVHDAVRAVHMRMWLCT